MGSTVRLQKEGRNEAAVPLGVGCLQEGMLRAVRAVGADLPDHLGVFGDHPFGTCGNFSFAKGFGEDISTHNCT